MTPKRLYQKRKKKKRRKITREAEFHAEILKNQTIADITCQISNNENGDAM